MVGAVIGLVRTGGAGPGCGRAPTCSSACATCRLAWTRLNEQITVAADKLAEALDDASDDPFSPVTKVAGGIGGVALLVCLVFSPGWVCGWSLECCS